MWQTTPNTLKIYCNLCFSDLLKKKEKKKKGNYCGLRLQGQLFQSSCLSLFAPRHKSWQEGAQSGCQLVMAQQWLGKGEK